LTKNLLLMGGIAHRFRKTSAAIANLLESESIDSTVTDDLEPHLRSLDGYDMVTVNALRTAGGGMAERLGSTSADPAYAPTPVARAAFLDFLHRGGAVLALHTAPICFDDWVSWGTIVGAKWDFGKSWHPPLSRMRVNVRTDAHPIVAGVEDFDVDDEVYSYMNLEPDVIPLMTSRHNDADHPLLWARTVGDGRSVYIGIGHDIATIENASYRTILRQSARWVLGR
jgi:type 1 glutamine amidotransferase